MNGTRTNETIAGGDLVGEEPERWREENKPPRAGKAEEPRNNSGRSRNWQGIGTKKTVFGERRLAGEQYRDLVAL